MESKITGSNIFLWSDVDWNALRALRGRFLQFDAAAQSDRSDYWRSASELAGYDFTFAERIGWKWDTVLTELKSRGWTPPAGALLDWGCGTGVAARRVVAAWPDAVRELRLWDRSGAARDFAAEKARAAFPNLAVRSADADSAADFVVISHVLNELSHEALERLLAVVKKAQAVLWVEPGTSAVSRQLIAVRERMLGQKKFRVVAPCTHAQPCGMLTAENARHWCHHFAKIPGHVHTDAGWARFSKTLEIDLSTLPFSFLVLDSRPAVANPEPEMSRVIGRPRHYKGFAKVLSCQSDGVRELVIQKRDAPELFKEMKKDPGSLYQWRRDGEKIRDGVRVF
jgi:ribosomal protein RSM22 (predicted rRNA methylase)